MRSCVKNGRLCVPGNSEPVPGDVVVDGGRIVAVRFAADAVPAGEAGGAAPRFAPGMAAPEDAGFDCVIDAAGCLVLPGLIDLHVHFRDPGAPQKEDTDSGRRAAARGGFTTVCAMPNTDPPVDSPAMVRYLESRWAGTPGPAVLPVAAITRGQKGRHRTDLAALTGLSTRCKELAGRGIAAISEDGRSVLDSGLLREAMEEAAALGVPVFSHCEDPFLPPGSAVGEQTIAARDILLALATGCRLHLCHVSCAGTVDLIRWGKAQGARLTAETAPHYFTLTEEAVDPTNGLAKMNPPLRTAADREAVRDALADGTIDAIATDHAPHEAEVKYCSYSEAANGVSGLETAFALAYTELVRTGRLTVGDLVERMSAAPARILGISRGQIAVGEAADLVLVDAERSFPVDPAGFVSRGKNTPFAGRTLFGKVLLTMAEGEVVYDDRPADR